MENKELTNMEKIIIEYIDNHPKIKYRELNKGLTKERKLMTSKTLKYYLFSEDNPDNLIEKGNIFYHSERMYNKKSYPEEFEVNPKVFSLHPKLWKKRKIDIIKDVEVKFGYFPSEYFDNMIWNNTQLFLDSKKDQLLQAGPFGFTFSSLVFSLMIECFFNNPQNWFLIKNPEDLDFQITIKANWSKDKEIFKVLMKHKKKCFEDGVLYPIASSRFSTWLSGEDREEILKGKTEEEIYHIANSKMQQLNKFGEKQDQKRKMAKPILLEIVDKELEHLKEKRKQYLEKEKKHPKKEEILERNQEKINNLIDLRNNIQKEYLDCFDSSYFEKIAWFGTKPRLN